MCTSGCALESAISTSAFGGTAPFTSVGSGSVVCGVGDGSAILMDVRESVSVVDAWVFGVCLKIV